MAKIHPYRGYPARQFWSKAVSQAKELTDIFNGPIPLIQRQDRVISIGSCFAANLIPYLELNGYTYLRTEYQHPLFASIASENMSYAKFSAGYGNIYTARQLRQLLLRCLNRFSPQEDRWITKDGVFDPFRPGLRYHARTEKEFEILRDAHFKSCLKAFTCGTVLILTLGLTEAWRSRVDGAVFPVCPGTIAGTFNADRHEFINFGVKDVVDDLNGFILDLRTFNFNIRIIITVSPVPLVATAENSHVLPATIYSKSVLRVAAEEICSQHSNVYYFPAYELACGPQSPEIFYEADKRNVSREAIDFIMNTFLSYCDGTYSKSIKMLPGADEHQQVAQPSLSQMLSHMISDIDCEEAALDII